MQEGGEGGSAMVAVEDVAAEPQIEVKMDVELFLCHCQACLPPPLKPPIFKCEAAGHVVCSYCRGGHGDTYSSADTRFGDLDAFLDAAKAT